MSFREFFFGGKVKPPSKELSDEQFAKVSDAVKPSDDVIDSILNETFNGAVARQWVNWAAEQIGEEKKYFMGHPMTAKSIWVLYEGCRVYKEKKLEHAAD